MANSRIADIERQLAFFLGGGAEPPRQDPLMELLRAIIPKVDVGVKFKKEIEPSIGEVLGLPTPVSPVDRSKLEELADLEMRGADPKRVRLLREAIEKATGRREAFVKREPELEAFKKEFTGIPRGATLEEAVKLSAIKARGRERIPTALIPVEIGDEEAKLSFLKEGQIVTFNTLQASMRAFAQRQKVTRESLPIMALAELANIARGGELGDINPRLFFGRSVEQLESLAQNRNESLVLQLLREFGEKEETQKPRPLVPKGRVLTKEKAKEFLNRSGGDRKRAEEMATQEGFKF